MGDNVELRNKLLTFVLTEWQRKNNRQLIGIDLVYTPLNGFRDEPIRSWVREDEPDIFADFRTLERLAGQIVKIAEDEVEAKPPGKHRFVVRCTQHAGSRPQFGFSLYPSYRGDVDEAIASPVIRHAGIHTQLFEDTIRVLCQQVAELTADNAALHRELEKAKSRGIVPENKSSHTKRKARRRTPGSAH